MTKKRSLRTILVAICISLFVFCVSFVGANSITAKAATVSDLTDAKTGVTLKDTDGDGFYEISNKNELDAFSSLVNTNPSINAELTADITYNSGDLSTLTGQTTGKNAWQPIGMITADNGTKTKTQYKGTFDGQNYTIYGLYYFDGFSYDVEGGLFSKLGSGGTIKNVTVAKSYFAGASYMGAIVGSSYGGSTIKNCHNQGSYVGAATRAGGIVGDSNNGTVTECTNSGTVAFYKVNDSISRTLECFGGISGSTDNGVISKCSNQGSILGKISDTSGAACVGGISGQAIDGGRIVDCLNKGNVISSKGSMIGGVVGFTYKGKINNCLSLGYVEGYQTVGHVFGGPNTPDEYNNNYYSHTVLVTREDYKGIWDEGKVTEANLADLASGKIAHSLGANWGQNIDNNKTNQGNPVVGGEAVYYGYRSCTDSTMVYSNSAISQELPHNKEYSQSGNTITAKCSDCTAYSQSVTLIAPTNLTYDGTEKNATVQGAIDGETIEISYVGDHISAGAHSASISVGNKTVTVNFEIEKANANWSAPTQKVDVLYSGSEQELLNAGSVSSLGCAWKYSIDGGNSWSERPMAKDVGEYSVSYYLDGGNNYNGTQIFTETVVVKPAPLTVKANDHAITYGDDAKNNGVQYIGFVGSDGQNSIEGTLTYSYNYAKGDNVGTYAITPSGLTAKNYTITYESGALTVEKANATVETAPTVISDLEYNGNEQNLVTQGSANLATMQYKVDDGEWSTEIPTAKNAGDYTVYYKAGDLNHNESETNSLKVTIKKTSLTITADDKTVCIENDCELTYTVSGLRGDDTLITEPTVETDANLSAPAQYSITVSGATASDNYIISYVKGKFTVSQHDWDQGEVTKHSTCTTEGEKTYVCQRDENHTRTEKIAIDENAHDYDDGVVTKEPSYTEKGEKTYVCQHNDKHVKTEDIPKLEQVDNSASGGTSETISSGSESTKEEGRNGCNSNASADSMTLFAISLVGILLIALKTKKQK